MFNSIDEIIASLRIQRDLLKMAMDKLSDRAGELGKVSDTLDEMMIFLAERDGKSEIEGQ